MARLPTIVRENTTAVEIDVAKRCAPTQQGFVRFQALELLLEGYSQGEVARTSGRDERTIQRWLAAFNGRGIDGLALKFHGCLREEYREELSYSTLLRYLHENELAPRYPRPRRVWVKKGSKPKVPYLGDHIRESVVGAVNPKAGDFFSLVVPRPISFFTITVAALAGQ